MCQNHSTTTCVPLKKNSTNYALEQALLAEDTVSWNRQRLLIVEAIEAGAQVDHPIDHIHGNLITALYLAVIRTDAELVKYLIQKGAQANLDLYDNSTIFSYIDSVAIAQQLVACGVKPTEKAGSIFGGLLHGLMQPVPQALELITFYLEHGANPNLPDWSGDTPLHILARMCSNYKNDADLLHNKITILRNAGADFNIKNVGGKTPSELLSLPLRDELHF